MTRLGLVVGAIVCVACSSEETKPSPIGTGSTGNTTAQGTGGGGTGGATGQGGSGGAGGSTSQSTGEGGSGGLPSHTTTGTGGTGHNGDVQLGDIPVFDVPDTECEATSAEPIELYPGEINPPGFDRLEKVGSRWFATGSIFPTGFVTFDADGANPSALPITVSQDYNMAASEGSTIAMVGQNADGDVLFGRYDDGDAAVLGPLTIQNEPAGNLVIGGGGGKSLILSVAGDAMQGRVAGAGDPPADPFEFASGTVDNYFVGSVTYVGPDFAAVWTGTARGQQVTSFAKLTDGGVSGSVIEVVNTATEHSVAKIVKTPTGYAMLVNANFPQAGALVLLLDERAVVVGARRFLGTRFGFDIAVRGTEIGIVAARSSFEVEFRSLDPNGTPLGPWVCLDGPNDNLFSRAAIQGDGEEYAIVHRTADQGEVFLRTDNLGSIAPR